MIFKSLKLQYFICFFAASFALTTTAHAAKKYSPSQVFAGVEYANDLLTKILAKKNIRKIHIPSSREKAAKPMHVYELHVSALAELYHYAVKHNRRPPPLAISTPIKYTPTDVYYLTELVINNLEDVYKDGVGVIDFSIKSHSGKTPVHVYQELFELYYKLNLLNGKSKVSPNEVYAHIYRAKEDLQFSLLTLSKRLDKNKEKDKRLLVTAIYGMHPDGSVLPPLEGKKTPGDVQKMSFMVRDKLNLLRKRNKLPEIEHPQINEFFGKVKPIDVFLQTQFIIAELNLLKIPMNINSTTSNAKPVTGKSPSDVYQEMKHLNYMLDRIIQVL